MEVPGCAGSARVPRVVKEAEAVDELPPLLVLSGVLLPPQAASAREAASPIEVSALPRNLFILRFPPNPERRTAGYWICPVGQGFIAKPGQGRHWRGGTGRLAPPRWNQKPGANV